MSYNEPQSRSLDLKRKRAAHESIAVEEIAWTAARCNRLLRSITSRIENLRRLLGPESCRPKVPSKPRDTTKKQHWSSADPVWLPNATKRPQIRTYASRPTVPSRQKEPPKVGKRPVLLPSPFMKSLRHGELPVTDLAITSPGRRAPKASRRSRQLPIKPGTPEEQNENGIVTALTSVLRSTTANSQPMRSGARSLLSTCLRKVPAYIDLEDESGSGDDDVGDSSTEILSYLEDLGTTEHGGWHGLREVVRSQSIHCIMQAILDNKLSEGCITQLVDVCTSEDALSEAEAILHAWYSQPDLSLPLQRLCIPGYFHQIRMRILRTFANDSQRMAEIVREPDFWSELLTALTNPVSHEATTTLHRCINVHIKAERQRTLSNTQHKSLSTGLKELSSKLCTMAITAGMLTHLDITHLQQGLYRTAIQVAFATGPNSLEYATNPFVHATLLLDGLAACDTEVDDGTARLRSVLQLPRCSAFGKSSRAIETAHQDFANSVSKDVVALGAHADLDLVSPILQRISSVLNSTTLPSTISQMLRQVALQLVTAHNQSGTHTHAVFTQELEQILSSTDNKTGPPQTPYRPKRGNRLRWEDGLCEWVMSTPFTAVVDEGDDVEHEQDKENDESIVKTDSSPVSAVRSPDVLALSPPPAKRLKRGAAIQSRNNTRRALVDVGFAHPQVIIPRQIVKRRQSRRTTAKQGNEDSDDELSF